MCPSLVNANLGNNMFFQNDVTIMCHNNQHNDIQHNDTQQINVTPSIMTFSITLNVSTKKAALIRWMRSPFENKCACPSLMSANLVNSMFFHDKQHNDIEH